MDDLFRALELPMQIDLSPTHRNANHDSSTFGCIDADKPQNLSAPDDLSELLGPQQSVFAMKYKGSDAILRVELDTCIGRGGSATVYSAELEQGPIRARVAVKVHHVIDDILRREMRIWRALSDPHILPFYGVCRLGLNQIGLVAPWMANGNLMQYLDKHPHASWMRLLNQVAEGLKYLHTVANVVHGDIKGENVLVSDEGNAMLADFGLSTTVVPGENPTATDICNKMSFHFAAPELIDETLAMGNKIHLRRSKTVFSDVYAFGTLIYQVHSRNAPWFNMTLQQICIAHLTRRMPEMFSMCSIAEDDRVEVWKVCKSCWKHAPSARPTAAQLTIKLLQMCTTLWKARILRASERLHSYSQMW